jgi:4-hydroxy-4-methyl-2-oxoglutarate aldolase
MGRLADIDAATIQEAHARRGALPSVIKPVDKAFRVAGPAFTVDCPPGDNLWIHRAVYAAAPGDVLVVDPRGGTEYGYWGEILSEAATARGLSGLVIYGGVRDTIALTTIGFPVFAACVCLQGTAKDPSSDGRLGAPITVGTTLINTGDLVIGDADGVVAIPAAARQAVIDAARKRMEKERSVIDRLRAGETTLAIYDLPAER